MASEATSSAASRAPGERGDPGPIRPIEISSLIVGDTAVARVSGEIDVATAPRLERGRTAPLATVLAAW